MKKLKIAAVSYINTYPFLFGIENYDTFINNVDLVIDTPAECAKFLIDNRADIGLIPVAVIPELKFYRVITDYCIGATNNVKTVVILTDGDLKGLTKVYLDYQSRTSVQLVKVLSKFFWQKNIEWLPTKPGYEQNNYQENEGVLVIGDRVFKNENQYKNKIDLAQEWNNFTHLPFVFAAWIINKTVNDTLIEQFNKALKFGLMHKQEALVKYHSNAYFEKMLDYLNYNIDYNLDSDKLDAMKLFLNYISKL